MAAETSWREPQCSLGLWQQKQILWWRLKGIIFILKGVVSHISAQDNWVFTWFMHILFLKSWNGISHWGHTCGSISYFLVFVVVEGVGSPVFPDGNSPLTPHGQMIGTPEGKHKNRCMSVKTRQNEFIVLPSVLTRPTYLVWETRRSPIVLCSMCFHLVCFASINKYLSDESVALMSELHIYIYVYTVVVLCWKKLTFI